MTLRPPSSLRTKAGAANLERVRQHAHAPRWTANVPELVDEADMAAVDHFRTTLSKPARAWFATPPDWVLEYVARMRRRSDAFAARIPEGTDLTRGWDAIAPMERVDLATRLHTIVPHDVDYERLVVYDTSSTTGHAVRVPTHTSTLARRHVIGEAAMALHGAPMRMGSDEVACVNLCAQASTFTFPNVFAVWGDAAFAKINLRESEWPAGRESARAFLRDLRPQLWTSDPISLGEALRWEIETGPRVIMSTAVELSEPLRARLREAYGCPVVDWYSLTETGPVAYDHPDGRGKVWAAPDLFVEIVDEAGRALPPGELGEIWITGGRNPFLPLLRYRTGDAGRVELVDGEPRLVELRGRGDVPFVDATGAPVNAVDIARALRERVAFIQHEFVQRADHSCTLRVKPVAGSPLDAEDVRGIVAGVFGDVRIDVTVDEGLGADGSKVIPYRSEVVRA